MSLLAGEVFLSLVSLSFEEYMCVPLRVVLEDIFMVRMETNSSTLVGIMLNIAFSCIHLRKYVFVTTCKQVWDAHTTIIRPLLAA